MSTVNALAAAATASSGRCPTDGGVRLGNAFGIDEVMVNDDPNSHEFDWVTARHNFSVVKAFRKLRDTFEKNRKICSRCQPDDHPYCYEFRD